MRKGVLTYLSVIVLVGVVLGSAYALWYTHPVVCEISGRPIHDNMHTVVEVDGKRMHACCPRCPLTLMAQLNEEARILSVRDFQTGETLAAEKAYFVSGSRIEVCTAPRMKIDDRGGVYVRAFDRCEPSLLAFAREKDARAFMAENGGTLQRLDELMREAEASRVRK